MPGKRHLERKLHRTVQIPLTSMDADQNVQYAKARFTRQDFPHQSENVKITEDRKTKVDERNVALFTKESFTDAEIFMTECFGSAIIDTACIRTVSG